MTIWLLCIIPLLAVGGVFTLTCCSAQQRLLRNIRKRRLKSLWWVHRHQVHHIEFTSQTTVRTPRQIKGEYNHYNAVMLNHFWLDGHFKNADMFLVKNLYEKKPTQM